MKLPLKGSDIKQIFIEIRDEMNRNKDLLTSLDAAMGDGDLGITMSEGFSKVVEGVSWEDEEMPGKLIMKAGMVMAQAVPSTMGTLMATAIMNAGKYIKDSSEIAIDDLAGMGKAAIDGIIKRGKAARGEKTILDSLIPAVEAFSAAVSQGESLIKACEKACDAARTGAEETKQMRGVHGRAAWYGDASIGKQDPGATAGMLVFNGIYNWALHRVD